jgi:surface polysaccharide O-acyltransferase-like enzyme
MTELAMQAAPAGKRRDNVNIELLRACAIYAVILIHCTMGYYYDETLMKAHPRLWLVPNFYYAFSHFCVPCFFIISAYFQINRDQPRSPLKTLKRVVLPFLFWSLVYAYVNHIHPETEIIRRMFLDTTNFHLWFLPVFTGYAALLPLLLAYARQGEAGRQRLPVLLVFGFSIVLPSLNGFLNGFGFIHLDLSPLNQFDFTLPSFLLFGLCAPFLIRDMKPRAAAGLYLPLCGLNMALAVKFARHQGGPNEFWYQYTSLFIFLSSFAMFNLFMGFDLARLSARARRLIMALGDCSFGIYLIHWCVFLALQRFGVMVARQIVIGPPVNAALIFCVAFPIILVWKRVPYLKEVV